jgi:hypothetical protein
MIKPSVAKEKSRSRKLASWLAAEEHSLFKGLRVRMGVASGKLMPGQDVKNSRVFDVAKGEWLRCGKGRKRGLVLHHFLIKVCMSVCHFHLIAA